MGLCGVNTIAEIDDNVPAIWIDRIWGVVPAKRTSRASQQLLCGLRLEIDFPVAEHCVEGCQELSGDSDQGEFSGFSGRAGHWKFAKVQQ